MADNVLEVEARYKDYISSHLNDLEKRLGGMTGIVDRFGNQISSSMDKATDATQKATASAESYNSILMKMAYAYLAVKVKDFAMGALALGEQLNTLSERTGASVESLSKWGYVARMTGSSLESFASALKFANISVNEITSGGKKADIMKSFGIDPDTIKTSDDLMLAMADVFPRLATDAERTALAMAMFGRNGIEMIPMLKEGSVELKKMREEAEKLGQVMSQKTAQDLDKANNAFSAFGTAMKIAVGKTISLNMELIENTYRIPERLEAYVKYVEDMQKRHLGNQVKNFQDFVRDRKIIADALEKDGLTRLSTEEKTPATTLRFSGSKSPEGIAKEKAEIEKQQKEMLEFIKTQREEYSRKLSIAFEESDAADNIARFKVGNFTGKGITGLTPEVDKGKQKEILDYSKKLNGDIAKNQKYWIKYIADLEVDAELATAQRKKELYDGISQRFSSTFQQAFLETFRSGDNLFKNLGRAFEATIQQMVSTFMANSIVWLLMSAINPAGAGAFSFAKMLGFARGGTPADYLGEGTKLLINPATGRVGTMDEGGRRERIVPEGGSTVAVNGTLNYQGGLSRRQVQSIFTDHSKLLMTKIRRAQRARF